MNRAVLVLAPMLALSGCLKIFKDLDQFKPTIKFKELRLRDIDFNAADVDFAFTIRNPNPIKVSFSSLSYDLDLAGSRFFRGKDANGLTLGAEKTSELVLPITVRWTDLIDTVGAIRGKDQIPFVFSGNFGFNTPLGEVKIPFERQGSFPMLQKPTIAFNSLNVGNLDVIHQTASLELKLDVSHEQGSPLSFADFDYDLSLDGSKVANGRVPSFATVEAGKTKTVTLPIDVNLTKLGAAAVNAIRQKEEINVGLKGDMKVNTPYGEIPLNLDKSKKLQLH